MDEQRSVEGLRSRGAGADPEDPYEGVDIDALPEWWRRAIDEFDAHDLRPYRPPRLHDGTLAHEVIAPLEREFGVDIGFRNLDPGGEWTVRIDGDAVGSVGRHRSADGYTVYEISGEELASLIRGALED